MFRTSKSISATENNRKRVFVGLSGGVDSAVSAALLKEQGHDITGVFIKVWQPDFLPCSWREERRDAMRVALALDIPFLFLDFEDEYKRGVADYMIAEYKAGRTPNPDVLCNKEIKFGAFWREAKKRGADFIATGHYAQKKLTADSYQLLAGRDSDKDQSYFLWTLTQDDLSHTLFPLGDLEKEEVRKLARKFGIPVADKKDSQGICFMGDVDLEEFLSQTIGVHLPAGRQGDVLDTEGNVIGTHRGALYYTLGQRHGFEVEKKSPESSGFYIISKDMKANTITVSDKEEEIISLSPKRVVLKDVNWIVEPQESGVQARIRYRGKKLQAKLVLEKKKLAVEFEEPQRGLSVGQSIVFYREDVVMGGAVMDKVVL